MLASPKTARPPAHQRRATTTAATTYYLLPRLSREESKIRCRPYHHPRLRIDSRVQPLFPPTCTYHQRRWGPDHEGYVIITVSINQSTSSSSASSLLPHPLLLLHHATPTMTVAVRRTEAVRSLAARLVRRPFTPAAHRPLLASPSTFSTASIRSTLNGSHSYQATTISSFLEASD